MKKSGFTLAEVLITLAIIGVVASLTLPALMQNSSEQQAKTALKKGINTLTEIAQTSNAIDGYDYAGIKAASSTDDLEGQSVYAMLARRGSIDMKRSGDEDKLQLNGNTDTAGNYTVYFRDGSAVSFPTAIPDAAMNEVQADGLPLGIPALFDINGTKAPNTLSNCEKNVAGVATESAAADCSVKANRVIKDQFGMRLRGGYAVPNGPAARWAFEN